MVGPNDSRFNDDRYGIPTKPWHEIVDGLFVGGSEHGFPDDEFAGVLSLYNWHSWVNRRDWYPADTVPHLILPMYDAKEIPAEQLELGALFIDQFISKDNVLVRCQAGLNRSSLYAAYYMCTRLGYKGVDAIDHIRDTRSPNCLFNKSFVYWLTYKFT